mmetsp:Transcript_85644/g.218381  ORF Transcript_85644/g.218381 Transcript_85644/m.218381 type:complete len:232 (-) Transcript_85644:546-1241(-)
MPASCSSLPWRIWRSCSRTFASSLPSCCPDVCSCLALSDSWASVFRSRLPSALNRLSRGMILSSSTCNSSFSRDNSSSSSRMDSALRVPLCLANSRCWRLACCVELAHFSACCLASSCRSSVPASSVEAAWASCFHAVGLWMAASSEANSYRNCSSAATSAPRKAAASSLTRRTASWLSASSRARRAHCAASCCLSCSSFRSTRTDRSSARNCTQRTQELRAPSLGMDDTT